jgi:hypothetical protein
MRRGILYLAKGEQFRRDVRQAARQVKEVMPNVPISIVTDKDLDDQLFDEVIVDRAEFETSDKPSVLQRTPYDRTIFLDTDIHLHSMIDELFDILNEFDLALVRDHMECNVPSTDQGSTDGVPEAFPELNSGVIAYVDCPEVIEFFKDWERRCHSDHDYDQRSLRPALYHSDVRLTMLPPRYNCLYSVVGCVNGEVKAFHTALGDRDRIAVDTEEAVRKLNAIERPRTYRPYEDTLLVDLAPPPLLKLWITLQHRGLRETLARIKNKARRL